MHFRIRADPHAVVDRRQHVLGANRVVDRIRGDAVAPSIDLAAANAAAGENGGGTRASVLTALLWVDSRRAAELAHRDDQRVVQKPALLKVVEQGGEGLIQRRQAVRGEQHAPTGLAMRDRIGDIQEYSQ
jgi:hypothetical protein